MKQPLLNLLITSCELCGVSFCTLYSSASSAAEAVDPTSSGSLLRITVSLLLVVGALVGVSVLFKKFGMNRITNQFPVKVIGAVSIGNNQRLMMIEVGEEWILLGVTTQQINTIATMPRQEPVSNANGIAAGKANFASWMQTALEKYNAKKP